MANLLRKLKIGSVEYPIQIGIHYGTCATAAGTAAKVVTLTNATGFELVTGAIVAVKFTNANSIANPTLNVNSTGAKAIMRYGTTAVSTDTSTTGWVAGAVQIFVYDGTNWVRDYWNNPTYSLSTFGVTATVAELNKLDGLTATTTELNYVDGVTSNIQTQLDTLTTAISQKTQVQIIAWEDDD